MREVPHLVCRSGGIHASDGLKYTINSLLCGVSPSISPHLSDPANIYFCNLDENNPHSVLILTRSMHLFKSELLK